MNNINKIFQIGFNKCGTLSLYKFFAKNAIPKIKAVHHRNGQIARSIKVNYKAGKPLLNDYKDITYFGDMEWINSKENYVRANIEFYKELDKQYPNSKFILNIRPIENWLKSRIVHAGGGYFLFESRNFNKTSLETLDMWYKEWVDHINDVKKYFAARPNDLLIYNIEKDKGSKIVNFFKDGLTFKRFKIPHYHNSKEKPIQGFARIDLKDFGCTEEEIINKIEEIKTLQSS